MSRMLKGRRQPLTIITELQYNIQMPVNTHRSNLSGVAEMLHHRLQGNPTWKRCLKKSLEIRSDVDVGNATLRLGTAIEDGFCYFSCFMTYYGQALSHNLVHFIFVDVTYENDDADDCEITEKSELRFPNPTARTKTTLTPTMMKIVHALLMQSE